MKWKGVRGARSGERGKHGEVSGNTGRRNKGESGGEFAFGARRFSKGGVGAFAGYDVNTTVFVDNLPMNVTKRELYKEFGLDRYVTDIFISRKFRAKMKSPFAFIRFQRPGGAIRAICRLNGKVWKGQRLFITVSKYRNQDCNYRGEYSGSLRGQLQPPHQRMKKVWVEVRRPSTKDNGKVEISGEAKYKEPKKKQEVVVTWSDENRDLMNRSLMGVCVEPIDFRKTMNLLVNEWMGEGEIECRDMGPYRCLVIFSWIEIKESSMNNDLLLSVFDEVRPHWEFSGTLSRRVWIEILGIPVGLWCAENLEKITKLWGKLVLMDDRTEEKKSFSVARVLVDSFRWETIHEWVSLRVDDKVFDVFAKEFDYESYSTESHPNLGANCPEASHGGSGTPRSTAVVLATLENVLGLNCDYVTAGEEDGKTSGNRWGISKLGSQCFISGVRRELVEFDPVICEAQIACNKNKVPLVLDGGPEKLALVPSLENNQSISPLVRDPVVAGYGLYPSGNSDSPRVPNCLKIVNQNTNSETSGIGVSNAIAVGWGVDCTPLVDDLNVAPLSQFNPSMPKVVVDRGASFSASFGDSGKDGRLLACDSALGDTAHSGESLCRINYEALQWERSSGIDTIIGVTAEEQARFRVNRWSGGVESKEEVYSDETLYLINEDNVGKFINGKLLNEDTMPLVDDENDDDGDNVSAIPNTKDLADLCEDGEDGDEIEQSDEENCLTEAEEAEEAKKVWSESGLSFYSNNEEEVLNRVADKKLVCKKRGELRQKRQRQGKKIPFIEGKTLSTRTLRAHRKEVHAGLKEIVKLEWAKNGQSSCLEKLKLLKNPIRVYRVWNKEKFGIINQKIATIEKEIQVVDNMAELGTIKWQGGICVSPLFQL
ncbi:hypothetical protein PIB30_006506 [Stylosanthes scabra]|uniref:RRM domain-containing protein n=1 Tax=Stylosanthes scabra TaxID=79078 RepID=A0ABU6W2C7_9FABA|nr:hypothetical protein [Stylosanthes scabra]